MNKITFLHGAETRRLRKIVQRSRNKALSRRANAVLLVLQGKTRVEVAAALQAARSSVNRWLSWYEADGIDGLESQRTGRPQQLPKAFIIDVLKLLIEHRPRDIGYQRSRWSTELLSVVLKRLTGLKVHSSTIRRLLPQIGIVWRRAAPTLRTKDPAKAEKLAAIYEALNNCSAEHPVFYEDEVDIHLNPKIGADWGYKPVLFMRALKVTHFRQLDDPLTVFGLGGVRFSVVYLLCQRKNKKVLCLFSALSQLFLSFRQDKTSAVQPITCLLRASV